MKHPIRSSVSRRAFLATPTVVSASGSLQAAPATSGEIGPLTPHQRRALAFHVRMQAAQFHKDAPLPDQIPNGDEQAFPNRIANFSKGLPHNSLGEVDLNAYQTLHSALAGGEQSALEAVPSGCMDPARRLKFVNPLAGMACDLEGADSHRLAIPPAPRFNSAETTGEMVELYWQALARDVPFIDYATSPLTQMAAAELSRMSDFRGPKLSGSVTPSTLFRGFTAGDLAGPYISQFLLKPVPFGSQYVEQRMRTTVAGLDYLTAFSDWLSLQNGCAPLAAEQYDPVRRYIRNGRDLATWVHRDVLFQAYFNACLILLTPPDASDQPTGGGIGAPLNPTNPYNALQAQMGFGTLGAPYAATMVAEAATRALKAVWFQKWFVHRRLRPEEFGGRVHNVRSGQPVNYPIHSDLLTSSALTEVFRRHSSYLLPQAYPEGAPLHPAYGAGHATVAGACVTMLKALFDPSFVIPNPVVPSADGLSLVPYVGPALTVGGELNKLAANVGIGRNFAGIHWRSDYTQSLVLGEAVAINILQDHKMTFAEDFAGFAFPAFDGTPRTV